MKNSGSFVLIGLLLVAGFAAFLVLGPLAEKPGMRYVEETPIAAPRGVDTAAKDKAAGEPAASAEGSGAAAVPSPPPAIVAGADASGVVKVGPPFPTASDVPAGTSRVALESRFGKPNMITTAVDRGTVIETYVYLRRNPNTVTVILLKGGETVGANTAEY